MTYRIDVAEKKNDFQLLLVVLAEERSDVAKTSFWKSREFWLQNGLWRECGARAGLLFAFGRLELDPEQLETLEDEYSAFSKNF